MSDFFPEKPVFGGIIQGFVQQKRPSYRPFCGKLISYVEKNCAKMVLHI